jgi:pimeloyl-ACP methyl ester carboxylesterase
MNKQTLKDLKGLTQLVIEATTGTTDLVEKVHSTIEKLHLPLGQSRADKTQGITGLVYNSIRSVAKVAGVGLDLAMEKVIPLLEDSNDTSKARDNFLAVINGVLGDRLAEKDNSLALEMAFFHGRQKLHNETIAASFEGVPEIGGKLMVFVHGLCMNHNCWANEEGNRSHDLAIELDYVPLYLTYNTGKAIATNGIDFADKLESLLAAWPTPVTELIIVGHSMGGLITRSAYHHGEHKNHEWLSVASTLVSLGSPHQGSPLERGGIVIEQLMSLSPYAIPYTRLTNIRSRGIGDLRFGGITHEQKEFVQLPSSVRYFALAALLNKTPNATAEKIIGDGLVPLDSAFGQSSDTDRTLDIPSEHKWIGYGLGHNEMLWDQAVFKQLQKFLTD